MENNSFKNKVQEQLSGLRFEPSDTVWTKVEQQLKKEKRRRRVIFFWLLLGALILGGGFITYFNNNTVLHHLAALQSADNKKEKIASADSLNTTTKFKTAATVTADSNIKTGVAIPAKQNDILSASDKKRVIILGKTRTKMYAADQDNGDAANFNEVSDGKTIVKHQAPGLTDSISENIVQAMKTEQKKTITDSTAVAITPPGITDKKNTADTANAVQQTEKKNEKKSDWTFAITCGLGVSNIGKGIGINANENNNSGNTSYSATGTPIAQPNSANTASPFIKGVSFLLGAAAIKKINRHFSLMTGLQYSYISTGQLTGNFEDTMANISRGGIAFRQGSTHSYINRFHFVSIPVSLQTKLFAYRHLSGDLITGISLQQMIATNALIYDTAVRIYYRKKSVFNKTGLAFNAGVMINYTLKNKIIISAGPQLMHGISSAGNDADYRNNYFNVWALKANYMLIKKNKHKMKTVSTQ